MLAAFAACVAVAFAPSAAVAADPSSFFWVNKVEGTIGGSALNGTGVNQRLIDLGDFKPTQLASHGDYVYWLDRSLNAIGRAKADGTSVDRRFLTGLAASESVLVSGLAVDSSGIYWTTWHPSSVEGRIARTNLDGSGRNDTFVTGLSSPAEDVATDATHVFWLWEDDDNTRPVIGRTSKTGTNTDEDFILGATATDSWRGPTGLATRGGFVYWTDGANGSIGRAQANGSGVQTAFITGLGAADPSDRLVADLVVTDSFIYWQEERSNDDDGKYGRIGRATLAGASASPDFVKLRNSPTGLAASGSGLVWSLRQHSGLVGSALDGSGINEGFIEGNHAGTPRALAADNEYLYWLDGLGAGGIARAKRDGTGLTRSLAEVGPYELHDLALDATYLYFAFQSYAYLEFGSGPTGIGRIRRNGSGSSEILVDDQIASDVEVTATHVYWAGYQNGTGPTIGRAAIDGTAVNPTFITGLAESPAGLVASSSHLFWTDSWNRRVGRSRLDGTEVNHTFYDNTGESESLAIDGTRLFWNGGTSDNAAGSLNLGAVQVASVDGLTPPSPFVEVFNPTGAFRTDPIGDIAIARTDLTTPVPPNDPPPEPPAPLTPEPTPSTPSPPAPVIPSGGAIGGATTSPAPPSTAPPTKKPARPRASLRSTKFRRNATVTLKLTAVPRGTRLTVAWRPKRGKTIRKTYRVKGSTLKVRAPKKRGQYTLTIKRGRTRLLSTRVTAR